MFYWNMKHTYFNETYIRMYVLLKKRQKNQKNLRNIQYNDLNDDTIFLTVNKS